MARASDWSPVDMDSDPTPGDPEEVRTLAEDLQEFADDVGEALSQIRGMASDRAVQDWSGLSADAFRGEFDGVPENLTKLQTSYDMAADALARYWPELQRAQAQADRALDRAIAAQADLRAAQTELGGAEDWVGRAGEEAERLQEEGEDPEPPSESEIRSAVRDHDAAEAAASAAQGRVDAAQADLSAARELARQAKEMREEAARICARDIEAASDAGIQNRSWWEDAIDWVVDNWDTIVDIAKLVVAVLGVVVMIIGGPLAWVVLAAALIVLADTLIKYARGEASLFDVAMAALDCIPGMKGLTTLGALAAGVRGLARTGLRGIRQGALGLGRRTRGDAVPMNGRNACGDPVDMATGELLMSATDVQLPGVLPLIIERHHISSHRHGRCFGRSWASTLDQRLELDEHGVRFHTADGMTLLYPRPDPDEPVFPVEGPRWGLTWDGRPGSPLTVRQRETGHTLRFAPVPGRPGAELPLASVTDRNGNTIRFAYDPATGAPTEVSHSGGYRVGVATERGRVTELRLLNDPDRPVLRRYDYHNGLLSEIHNSSGLPLTFTYDDHARITRWEDRNGYWYAYEYDEDGRCVHTTGSERALEYHYAYDAADHRTTVTDSLGHATVHQFNDSFQLTAETDPLGNTTAWEWDRYDRATGVTDPVGTTTRFRYDGYGDLLAIEGPAGTELFVERDAAGQPVRTTLADGSVWAQVHDDRGNRVAITDPAGNVVRLSHHPTGATAETTDQLGHSTRRLCDAAGLPVAVTDGLGRTTRFDRDAFGRVVRRTDPLGATTTTEWTVDGQPARVTNALGGQRTWARDAEGNVLELTDENGGVARSTYGVFDLETSKSWPDGRRYTFERDSELRLTAVRNSRDETWDFGYDEAGRLVAESDFDGRVTRYARDAAGRVTSRVNAAGQSVRYTRDFAGRVVRKETSEGAVTTFEYDEAGRVVAARSPGVELVRTFDVLGNLLTETVNGRTLSLTHDPLGRPLSRTTPAGHVTRWERDEAGRAVALNAAGRTVTFHRDPAGRLIGQDVFGILDTAQSWDAAARLTEQTVTAARAAQAGPGAPASSGGGPMVRRTFAYRADHYPVSVSEPSGETRYRLDPVGRVLDVEAPDGRESYRYNDVGDQLSARWGESASSDGGAAVEGTAVGDREYRGGLLTRAGGVRYWYDDAGRVIKQQRTRLSRKPDVWRYVWDAEDRLARVVTPDGTLWRYLYDPFGRRVAKQRLDDGGEVVEETTFTWDETQLVEQRSGTPSASDGAATTTWEYDGLRPVAQIERLGPDADQDAFDRRFYAIVTDLASAPTHLVDEDGSVAWHARASLWGVPTQLQGDARRMPLRFPGQYADAETGWHYNLHRYYDPFAGRYTSPDPLGLGPSPHVFGYPHNPLTWSDALGLAAHPVGEIRYNSTDLSQRAFQERRNAGYWDADHNVAVARVQGLDELIVGFSGAGRHSEGHILQQLEQRGIDPQRVIDLYTERQPCANCQNLIDSSMGQVNVSWSVPYYNSPPLSADDALLMNQASADLLSDMIRRADGR
ncbi:DUF6531 domain-containing protein [Streptomyces radicis]|uniref:Type IV secretion protein Rhs n=1 Tax=Streptomyces radicis TaxID=1750517 RepID=A0A3A9W4Y6_9ACTN|nr:DUF6531 domain-containing protein [Streptomyces radicis]RKN04314.1 hypothetical protein D7319_28690 [Streptomyces radicis]RKN14821.1 hypothetical protein D7318_28445 [Streptomyces radicis]